MTSVTAHSYRAVLFVNRAARTRHACRFELRVASSCVAVLIKNFSLFGVCGIAAAWTTPQWMAE
jgi:hypothetical protein